MRIGICCSIDRFFQDRYELHLLGTIVVQQGLTRGRDGRLLPFGVGRSAGVVGHFPTRLLRTANGHVDGLVRAKLRDDRSGDISG